jgi:FOG: PKD repeat
MKGHLFKILFFAGMCISYNASAQLKAGFSANTTAGCSPLVVQFQDSSAGNPTSWHWDLGNGTISLFQNPSTVYFAPGTYTVKQVVKNASGADSVIKQQFITVYDNPVVDFTASDSIGCFPLPVYFTDKSTVAGSVISQWNWDFGDGDTSNLQHPSHTYTGPGNHTVTLKVTSDKGCSKTISKPQYININTGVIAGFRYTTVSNSCSAPVEVRFENTSVESGVVTYQWDFGDGAASTEKAPRHTYTANGSYTVTLVAMNESGCRDTLKKENLLVIGATTTGFTMPDSICAGQAFPLVNTSTPAPASVNWHFSDGSSSTQASPLKTFAAPGVYTVKLINHFATCTDSITKSIKVLPKPTAAFNSNSQYACRVPATIQFNNTAAHAVAYSWDFGDGATSTEPHPIHTYTAFGTYDVRLVVTGANGCTDTLLQKAHIRVERPQVRINDVPVKGCLPLQVPFSATVGVDDNITGYRWDFGDGASSTLAKPVHTYTQEGTYTVKLVITTAGGCTDSVIVANAVEAAPVPVAEFSTGTRDVCNSSPIQFINESQPSGDQWLWDFGDGRTSGAQNPIHQYSDTGYFDITLIVTNKGCSDTIEKKNYIHVKPPFARYDVKVNCNDRYKRTFTDKSIGAETWLWNFGDGATSTDMHPVHTYAARGVYHMSLTVTNGNCEETNTKTIIIADEHLDFAAAKREVCKGESVAFSLQHFDPIYTSKVVWHFGDGATSNVTGNVSHVYKKSGVYKVKIVYTDVNGCVDSTVKDQYITVFGPTADFDAGQPNICMASTATFNDRSATDNIHPITNWTFHFGDGQSQQYTTAGPYTHLYNKGGNFNVTLKVIDSYGCADSVTKNSVIKVSDPRAAFSTPDTASCPGAPVRFANTSSGSGLTYSWHFGDGATTTVKAPAHQYSQPGVYTVRLAIQDGLGCRDSIERVNYIRIVVPKAAFALSDSVGVCPPLQVQFTNQASGYSSVKWDFGDGSTSVLDNPIHFYNLPGTFYAKQIVTVPGGCTDTLTRKIVVKGPSGSFTYTPLTGCLPLQVNFQATGNGIASMIWDFNDGATQASDKKTMQYTYNTAGSFVPRLVLIDSAGCQVPITGNDTVNAIGVTVKATMDTYQVCDEGYVQFTDQSVANDFITGHIWDFGDGTTSTQANPRHYYQRAPALYTIKHTVTTEHGCTATLTFSDTVRVYKVPQISIRGLQEACVPAELGFRAAIDGDASNLQLHWQLGNGQTASQTDTVTQTYSAAGVYNLQLHSVYNDFCRDTAYHTVNIWPLPNTFAGDDTFVCRDAPQQLKATGAERYTWTATPDISCTDCAEPMINPAVNTTYTVTGYSSHGCVKTDSVYVRVRQPFTLQVAPGDTLCQGENMTLSASGADLYQWYPATGLDNAQAAAPKASPSVTTTYTVVGTDSDHCFTDTGMAHVVVYPVPQIFAGNDTTVSTGTSFQLHTQSSNDVTQWRWAPAKGLSCTDCPNPKVSVKTNITYKVTVSNGRGCTSEDELNIVAVCNNDNYFIPNTFSPNNDGNNDVFYVRGKGLHRIQSMRIFNRWGQVIFEKRDFSANDPSAGWDGTFNGKPADMDVYIYLVEVICDNNSIVPYKGNVALIR